MLINKKAIKQYALDCASCRHHKFTRVSKEFLIYVEAKIKTDIRNYIHSLPSIGATIKTFIALTFLFCSVAHAEPDYNQLADAIRRAEGNPNYGVLTKYKHTTPRQACINTCRHAWKDYVVTLPWKTKPARDGYIKFLANRYAPRGVANDPTDLNRNWPTNVSRFYKGGV